MAQPALAALDQALAAAVQAAAPAVVHVTRSHHGAGSGIVWGDHLVISSSFHTPDRTRIGLPGPDGRGLPLAGSAAEGRRGSIEGELEYRDAEVIGRDAGTDVALLRVEGEPLVPAKLREVDGLAVGNLALAIGRPGRSARASMRMIGVLGHEIRTPWGGRLEHYIESDRQIPRGFAGGPLIDAEGDVIGMNTRTLIRGTDVAVPVVTLRRVVAELSAHGGVRRGYLGVGAYPATLPAALATLAGRTRAALVASLEDDGPAAAGGVGIGDLLIELDGVAITDPESLRTALGDRPGKAVTLVVLRGGARIELPITLASQP